MRLLLFLLLLMFSHSLYSQKISIPQKVEMELNNLYPEAMEIEWELKIDKFEADFELGDKDLTVLFDSLGTILSTESSIEIEELAETIRLGIVKEFPGFKINDIISITIKDQTIYEVGLEKGKKSYDAIFSSMGELMQKEDLSDE